MNANRDFRFYLDRWSLVPDGDPIATRSSRLLPVRRGREPAMLKVAAELEERGGAGLMIWWNGTGAARVIEHDDDAVLLERATGRRSLADMASNGEDDDATRIICDVVARLHAPRDSPSPQLVPLTQWFRALDPMASREGGILVRCAATALALLADPHDVVALHGDVHHRNVLDFEARGWLAIDPKGLEGERGFDYANLFCNPDHTFAATPGRLARQADVVAETARLERERLLQWIVAWAGLSASWLIEDREDESAAAILRIAEIAAAELDRH